MEIELFFLILDKVLNLNPVQSTIPVKTCFKATTLPEANNHHCHLGMAENWPFPKGS
jgi:hypothetical protein